MRLRHVGLALPLLLAECQPACEPATTDTAAVEPGNCESYWPLMQQYGLPRAFLRIAWRESGCNHNSFVIDRDDAGGGLLGINLKGNSLARGWHTWCGATLGNITDAEVNIRCAAVAYQKMGMAPWR